MCCWAVFAVTDRTGNRTETTVLFRFLGLRDRTGTDFFGSGSFGSGSRFFRFGSRFPVLCAQSEGQQLFNAATSFTGRKVWSA
jgi:hypothetical protein